MNSGKKFREYVAAQVDGETALAAEIYVNCADDKVFLRLIESYHLLIRDS